MVNRSISISEILNNLKDFQMNYGKVLIESGKTSIQRNLLMSKHDMQGEIFRVKVFDIKEGFCHKFVVFR